MLEMDADTSAAPRLVAPKAVRATAFNFKCVHLPHRHVCVPYTRPPSPAPTTPTPRLQHGVRRDGVAGAAAAGGRGAPRPHDARGRPVDGRARLRRKRVVVVVQWWCGASVSASTTAAPPLPSLPAAPAGAPPAATLTTSSSTALGELTSLTGGGRTATSVVTAFSALTVDGAASPVLVPHVCSTAVSPALVHGGGGHGSGSGSISAGGAGSSSTVGTAGPRAGAGSGGVRGEGTSASSPATLMGATAACGLSDSRPLPSPAADDLIMP